MSEYNFDYGAEYEPEYWAGSRPSFDASAGGWGYDPSTMAFSQNPLYEGGTPSGGGWGYDPSTGQFSQAPLTGADYTTGGEGSGGWGSSILGALGSVGSFLGKNAGTLGPLLSGAGSLAGGAIGSNAANEAARLQAAALNRGIDLQTAQWLQQQGNLAPYLQAGQQGLSQLQQLAGRQAPEAPFQGGSGTVQGASYGLPGTTPGWSPQYWQGPQGPNAGDYRWSPQQGPSAQDYRWNPQQGPSAQDYRYTPGQTPDAAQYASGPPQLYQGAMPGTQVPTLSGQELLAQDPGAAFRQSEARKALEGSAAARGDLLSGGTLQALQSRSQDLASQEYGNAWERMMAKNKEQYGRDWGQYQQRWGEGVTGAELGLRTQQQNFAQAEAASRLREQVSQVASQQGWSQAQAEAAFREGMAQQSSQQGWGQAQAEAAFREQQNQVASQQGWNQALAGQQNQYSQGLQSQQWNQEQQQKWQAEQYARMLEQSKLRYSQDVYSNQTDYDRTQNLYKQQLAQYLLPWEQQSTLATLGGQAVGMYGNQGQSAANSIATLLGRQGEAQGMAPAASGLSWQRALTGATNQVPSLLASLNA